MLSDNKSFSEPMFTRYLTSYGLTRRPQIYPFARNYTAPRMRDFTLYCTKYPLLNHISEKYTTKTDVLHRSPFRINFVALENTHNETVVLTAIQHMYVVNFDALAQASDSRIKRRQVVFLCWMQDSKLGSLIHQFVCSYHLLTNRLSYRGSS